MKAIEVRKVSKSFEGKQAVRDLSFEVSPGEIFALLGPNGAGKTTTLRMMLDIVLPDSGEVAILGGPLDEKTRDRIGYLPEERGLYQDLKVLETLVYFAELKGIPRAEGRKRGMELLARMELQAEAQKKTSTLSKGMQQKLQLVAALVHDPDVLVVDEPFSGLDPVNTDIVNKLLAELRGRGKAIVLSSHVMSQIEDLADRICLVDHGRVALAGSLSEIKKRFARGAVRLEAQGDLEHIPGTRLVRDERGRTTLVLLDGTSPKDVLRQLVDRGIEVQRFEQDTPSLSEIFVSVVSGEARS